jgi:hypothetical protein
MADNLVPRDVPGALAIVDVQLTGYHACAFSVSGGVLCWGGGSGDELGNGSELHFDAEPVIGIEHAVAIAIGDFTGCALLTDQSISCWGLEHLDESAGATRIVDVRDGGP